jgi:hypothetical protein
MLSSTMDFTTNMCPSTLSTSYGASDTVITITSRDPTNVNLISSGGAPNLPVIQNCPNVVAGANVGDPIQANQFAV